MTRATNLMRARKCQELLPEAKKPYDRFMPIEENKMYANYYRECIRKGTPIPNGPAPPGMKPPKGKDDPKVPPSDPQKPPKGKDDPKVPPNNP